MAEFRTIDIYEKSSRVASAAKPYLTGMGAFAEPVDAEERVSGGYVDAIEAIEFRIPRTPVTARIRAGFLVRRKDIDGVTDVEYTVQRTEVDPQYVILFTARTEQ